MYKNLETAEEKNIRKFVKRFCKSLGWKVPISRFKFGRMSQNRGYCMVTSTGHIFVLISNNPTVYHPHIDADTQLWHCVAHEIIHLKMFIDGLPNSQAFGHGKKFRQYCQYVADNNSFFTVKGLMK